MKEPIYDKFLAEAVRIGDQLMAVSQKDENGIYWNTLLSKGRASKVWWAISEDLFNGVSGIALFFLELYKKTNEVKYFNTARDSFNWLVNYCKHNVYYYDSFYSGRKGICWALLKMYDFTKESKYIVQALEIAKIYERFPISKLNDLHSGISGTILGYLHLHAKTKEKWILEKIDIFLEAIFKSASFGRRGIYWNRFDDTIASLCGFAFGAAGIGFVFLELGHYFKNPSFYWIAEQAFTYESLYFDKKTNNWADLRKPLNNETLFRNLKKSFQKKDMSLFTSKGDVNSWCFGAAGIGLSRLRAFELLNKRLYRQELEISIKRTVESDLSKGSDLNRPLIYSYGKSGNAELFLEYYLKFKKVKYLNYATEIACTVLKSFESGKKYKSGFGSQNDEDWSLFMGNAGLGYFYLRVLDPVNTPSVLYPKLDSIIDNKIDVSGYKNLSITKDKLKKQIVKNHFERTVYVLDRIIPADVNSFFKNNGSNRRNELSSFIGFVKCTDNKIGKHNQKLLDDVFSLEHAIINVDRKIPSYAYLSMKSKINEEEAGILTKLDNQNFMDIELILDREIKMVNTSWNWVIIDTAKWDRNFEIGGSSNMILLIPSVLKVNEVTLSSFAGTVVQKFMKKCRVREAVASLMNDFETFAPKAKHDFTGEILGQIKQFVLAQILIKA